MGNALILPPAAQTRSCNLSPSRCRATLHTPWSKLQLDVANGAMGAPSFAEASVSRLSALVGSKRICPARLFGAAVLLSRRGDQLLSSVFRRPLRPSLSRDLASV